MKLIQTNVAYPVECQNILGTLGPAIDADYFMFDGTEGTCTLYNGDDRSCSIFSGPDYPDYSECEGPTQAPPATTTMGSVDTTTTMGQDTSTATVGV